jgi:hypothetical protein
MQAGAVQAAAVHRALHAASPELLVGVAHDAYTRVNGYIPTPTGAFGAKK